ncbi:hypothetical protein [Sorangium sp. So ce887]
MSRTRSGLAASPGVSTPPPAPPAFHGSVLVRLARRDRGLDLG